jgi:uroporphyrinogen decarboxylase
VTFPQARELIGRPLPLQGNLDPQLLTGPWEYVKQSAEAILEEAKEIPSHIFNLGHGVTPGVNPDVLAAVVQHVHERTKV